MFWYLCFCLQCYPAEHLHLLKIDVGEKQLCPVCTRRSVLLPESRGRDAFTFNHSDLNLKDDHTRSAQHTSPHAVTFLTLVALLRRRLLPAQLSYLVHLSHYCLVLCVTTSNVNMCDCFLQGFIWSCFAICLMSSLARHLTEMSYISRDQFQLSASWTRNTTCQTHWKQISWRQCALPRNAFTPQRFTLYLL